MKSTLVRLAAAVLVVFALVGMYVTYGVVQQVRVDVDNFRKIVLWVAQKQAQEELARQRAAAAAQLAKPPDAPPAPVKDGAR